MVTAIIRVIGNAELTRLSSAAAGAARRRKNLNIHPVLDDPVQRLFNAMEPGTYVRPHRHARSEGWELMLAVRGAFSLLAFDERGKVIARADLEAGTGDAAVEIPGYVWHAAVAMAPGTVMFEVKPGPYRSLDDKDFALWAPQEGDRAAADMVAWYETAQPGMTWPRCG
jgi:cupin fold WbuC family metalloprotein